MGERKVAEPITIQKLIDASLDSDSLEVVVNGDENTDVTTRLGESYPTVKKAINLMTQAGIGFTAFETKALMTASSLVNGAYAVVTNDITANLGIYLKKSGAWTLTPWNNFTNLDSLKINSGKVFPFRNLQRNGITKPSNQHFMNAILNVSVVNAKADSYYQLTYYANGNTGSSPDGNGWRITCFNSSTFSTASEPVRIVEWNALQTQPKAGAIDTVVVTATTGEIITITIDSSKLPARGIAISSTGETNDGYSDIIDPSNYLLTKDGAKEDLAVIDSLKINSGKTLPLKKVTRGTINNPSQTAWVDAMLGATVTNAKKGFYYQVSYYSNGNTAFLPDGSGWILTKIAIADYISNTGTGTALVNQRTAQTVLKANSVDTINITASTGEVFNFTVDTSKLPASGSAIVSNASQYNGYSDIIDPSNYYYTATDATPVTPSMGSMATTLTSAGLLTLNYFDGNQYQFVFGKNGFNNLPNFISFAKTLNSGVSWINISEGSSDWLPPINMAAKTNGDGVTNKYYTGGNHGSDGGSGGAQTARNVFYDVKIDGVSKTTYSGFSQRIDITIVNELMAYNTITLGRYVLRETYRLVIIDGVITITAQRTPLEPVSISIDNGIQGIVGYFRDTYLVLDGKDITRQVEGVEANGWTSGTKLDNPKAWATIFHGSDAQLVLWMDRGYGAGDGRYVTDTSPYIRHGELGNRKLYNAVVAGGSFDFAANESYKWRGGVHVKSIAKKPTASDSMFMAGDNRIIAYSAIDYMTV